VLTVDGPGVLRASRRSGSGHGDSTAAEQRCQPGERLSSREPVVEGRRTVKFRQA